MTDLKRNVAEAALEYIEDNTVVGVGSGTTVNYFIDSLATIKHRIEACVVASKASERRLLALGIPVMDLNSATEVPVYVDGADEVNPFRQMIKGGGGAHTREKIIASVAKQFVCIVDTTKCVEQLGAYPLAVEVIPMARSFVARELVKLGGDPQYRSGFTTDNGNVILDVFNLPMSPLLELENAINAIPGVIENGLFARRTADIVLISDQAGVRKVT